MQSMHLYDIGINEKSYRPHEIGLTEIVRMDYPVEVLGRVEMLLLLRPKDTGPRWTQENVDQGFGRSSFNHPQPVDPPDATINRKFSDRGYPG